MAGAGRPPLIAVSGGRPIQSNATQRRVVIVRNLIRWLTGQREQRRPAEEVQRRRPLRPWQIRSRCFTRRWRGVDPAEIRAFLHQVAEELTVAQIALVAVQEENVRIKNALRTWQSAQSARYRYQ